MKKQKKNTIDIDKLKNGIIITLILIIVFGGSFMASQLSVRDLESNTNKGSESVMSDSNKAAEESAAISEDEKKELSEIDVEKYLELKDEKEASAIYIARPTCQYCQIQEPIIRNVAYEYNLTIHYLNTDEMSSEDSREFVKSDDAFKEGFGTPCTIVVKDGKIVGKVEGLMDRQTMVDFFKSNGIIIE